MAYMNQEKKSKIAAALKPVLAKYGMKGSLSVCRHSTIVLTLQSGAIDFDGKHSVNIYWIAEQFNGVAKDFLLEALDALRSADWFDESDPMVDYYHTAYYVDINLGRWDKPYVYTGEQKVAA